MLLLLRWLSARSLRVLHGLGGALGWATYLLSPSYRKRLDANAALAGIEAPERRKSVAEAGRMTMELPRLWLRAREMPIADPLLWRGQHHIEAALDAGRGLVLLTPHLGSFEVCAQAYAQSFGARQPITVLYRPARQPWLRELEETARARPALATAPATLAGVRLLMRALKRGETIGLLPDQVPPDGMGVWSPFYGKPAYTMTLAAKLVRQTGAAVLAIWCERLPRGGGYAVEVMPLPASLPEPPPSEEQAALVADADAINRSMELLIARKPSQYLWGYHRYKHPRGTKADAAAGSAA